MNKKNIEDTLIDEMIDEINEALDNTLIDNELVDLTEKASDFKSSRKKIEIQTLLDENIEKEIIDAEEDAIEKTEIVEEVSYDACVTQEITDVIDSFVEEVEPEPIIEIKPLEETGIFDVKLSRQAKKEQEKLDKKEIKHALKQEKKGSKKKVEDEIDDSIDTGKKKLTWQFYFNLISVLFIVGCCLFYGFRLIKYYRIFNPKGEDGQTLVSLGAHIKQNNVVVSTGDGLYNVGGNWVYKGTEINNYVTYSGMTWRIVKVNMDNTVKLVTDKIVNNLIWDSEGTDYLKSNIHTWLNNNGKTDTGIFEKALNDPAKYLEKPKLCTDNIDDLNEIVCSDYQEIGHVSLLGVTDYANSVTTDSYINNTENLWLYNSTSASEVWNVTDGNITSNEPNNGFGIKASITLKNTVVVMSGDGTLENPFVIEEKKDNVSFGDYIELGEDIWQVYEVNDKHYRLIKNELYNDEETYKFSHLNNKFTLEDEYTLAWFLNKNVYDSFEYSDKLSECDWAIGTYESEKIFDFKNIFSEKVSAKVGLYNIADIKLNSSLDNYFLLTPNGKDRTFVFETLTNLSDAKSSFLKPIRPAICIARNTDFKIGNGTIDKPYRMEAK